MKGSTKKLSWIAITVSNMVRPTADKPYLRKNVMRKPKPSNNMTMMSRKILYSAVVKTLSAGVVVQVKKSTRSKAWVVPKRVEMEQTMVK